MGVPENYYEAPHGGTALPVHEELPTTVAGKIALALRLLFGNLYLISAVVLTVWIPVHVATAAIVSHGSEPDKIAGSFRASTLTEAFFGPIVAGAVIWIVRLRIENHHATYLEAMSIGFRSWGAIFAARFVAGLIVLLGLIALIVPGIIMNVRFALIDQVATLENPGASRSRHRSAELVQGQAWQVYLVQVLGQSFLLLMMIGGSALRDSIAALQNPAGTLALDCVIEVTDALPICLLTVFYLEAAARKPLHVPETSCIADAEIPKGLFGTRDPGSIAEAPDQEL